MLDTARLEQEALRLYARYESEVVLALSFCPWAADAEAQGQVRRRVVLGTEPTIATVLQHVDAVEQERLVAVGLLIFPQLGLDRVPFQRFAATVRQADSDRKELGGTLMAMADFHPNATADMATPERLVSFIRRSPDPTIQLVRRSVLSEVRMTEDQGTSFVDGAALSPAKLKHLQKAEPLAARVARANHRTVQQTGVEDVSRILEDILEDRRRSYAALGLPDRGF